MTEQKQVTSNRSYRVTFKGPQSQAFIIADSAQEASEAAAKAIHEGQEVVVEDGATGLEISEAALAELVKQGL